MWTRTRDEELRARLSRRRALGWTAVLLVLAAFFVVVFGLSGVPEPARLPALVLAGLAASGGVGALLARQFVSTRPDHALPREVDLPLDDPRSFRSLAERRRLWLLGFGLWLAGWAVGLGAVLLPSLPAWARLSLFLGATWSTVLLGARLMRRWTGSSAWPMQ